jgi:hypothetical protein
MIYGGFILLSDELIIRVVLLGGMQDGIEGGEFGFLAGLKENLELVSIRCYHALNCEDGAKYERHQKMMIH